MMKLKQFSEFKLDSVTTQLMSAQNSECSQVRGMGASYRSELTMSKGGDFLPLEFKWWRSGSHIYKHSIASLLSITFALLSTGSKNSGIKGGKKPERCPRIMDRQV